jgi:hypothetical protein
MAKVTLTIKTSAMKIALPIISAALFFSSCSSVYKSGQTPDDVYFSPARPQEEYVQMDQRDDKQYSNDEDYRDDQYLRMRVQNRRWATLEDDWYSYNPSYYYSYNNSIFYNSPFYNSYHGFWNYSNYPYYNNCYNPYYTGLVYAHAIPVYNKPRTYNLNTYNPLKSNANYNHGRVYNNYSSTGTSSPNTNNYKNSGSNAGQFLRNVFNSSGSNTSGNSGSTNSSSRNNSSNSSSSSSSSNSSSGHASVRKF